MIIPDLLSLIQSGLAGFGGISAAYLFFAGLRKEYKSRAFASRLELNAVCELLKDGSDAYLRVKVTVKNIGAARAVFKPENSYIRVCYMERSALPNAVIEPEWLKTIETLPNMRTLETGESTGDLALLSLPHSDYLALHVEFGVTTRGITANSDGRDWRKVEVVNCKLQPNN